MTKPRSRHEKVVLWAPKPFDSGLQRRIGLRSDGAAAYHDHPGAKATWARTSALDAIPLKIELLVAWLGSSLEEMIFPCRPALGRQFDRMDLSFRDLAHPHVPALPSQAETLRQTTGDDAKAVAWTVAHEGGGLSAGELDFICSIRRNLQHWGQSTPKWAKWLDNIMEGNQQSDLENVEEVA